MTRSTLALAVTALLAVAPAIGHAQAPADSAPAAITPTLRRAWVRRAYARTHPCPYKRGCVFDHRVPLACGGLDGPPRDTVVAEPGRKPRTVRAWRNVHWMTPGAAALKDKTEGACSQYRGHLAPG